MFGGELVFVAELGRAGGVVTTPWSNGEVLRPCARFSIPSRLLVPGDPTRAFPWHHTDLDLAGRIASTLGERGYAVSNARTGKGGGAGFWARLSSRCEVTVHLGVDEAAADACDFYMLSWQRAPLARQIFLREPKPSSDCDRRWKSLCEAIDDILKDTFESGTVTWLTEKESNAKFA